MQAFPLHSFIPAWTLFRNSPCRQVRERIASANCRGIRRIGIKAFLRMNAGIPRIIPLCLHGLIASRKKERTGKSGALSYYQL